MIGSVEGMMGCMPNVQKGLQSWAELTVLLSWRILRNIYLRVKNPPLIKPLQTCKKLKKGVKNDSRNSEQGRGKKISSASFLPLIAA